MRGVALSDLHLGFTGPGCLIGGRNGRELDVERAWAAAVQLTIDAQPDLVTIAGDVFHSTRPSFHAVKALQDGVRRLVTETFAHIVIILGNHESPRTAAALSPVIVVDGIDRVHVVTEFDALPLVLDNGELANVACFPFNALSANRTEDVKPDPTADVNVCVIHAAVRSSTRPDTLPTFYAAGGVIDVGTLADEWDVVACGDYHEFALLHPTRLAFYSGSIERTSSNIWAETQPKCAVLYDTAAGEIELLEIPTRPVFDFGIGDAMLHGSGAATINEALRLLLPVEHVADAIVRMVVNGVPRGERDSIDWATVRQLKERCFHFQLDLRYATTDTIDLGDRRERRHLTLEDDARQFLAAADPAVRACALGHLGFGEAA